MGHSGTRTGDSAYDDGTLKNSLGHKNRHPILDVLPKTAGRRRQLTSSDRSFSQKSPEFLSRGSLIKMPTLCVDLGPWKVVEGLFLMVLLVEHLLCMMMAMEVTWNNPQAIMIVTAVITVLYRAQNVPILQLSVIFHRFFVWVQARTLPPTQAVV